MKRILSLILAIPMVMSAGEMFKVHPSMIQRAPEVGNVKLYHNGSSFMAKQNGVKKEVGSDCVDATLRKMTPAQLLAFSKMGHIGMTKASDGSIMLRSYVHGKGGGFWGAAAGFWVAKGVVTIVGHGLVEVACLCTGPLYPTIITGAHLYAAGPIEAAANTAALAGSIAVGAATGPV